MLRSERGAGRAAGSPTAGTDLLPPVSRRELATWCPQTGRSPPSPCSAASLKMSLIRSCRGSARRPSCPHHPTPPVLAAAQLRPGSLAMERVAPAAGGAPHASPGALPSPAGWCPAGQGGGWGCLWCVGGEESQGLCPCWVRVPLLQPPPRLWLPVSPPPCLGRQLLPPGKGAVPTTSPLPRGPCTHAALGGLQGSCPLLGKHSSRGSCGQPGAAPAGLSAPL